MLVISRREQEAVHLLIHMLDQSEIDIVVKVLQIEGRIVRLGVQAGPEVRILRDELLLPHED